MTFLGFENPVSGLRIKHCYQNCHFLSKQNMGFNLQSYVATWTKEERKQLDVETMWNFLCWRGVWDSGIDNSIVEDVQELLAQDRRGKCFFVGYAAGMTFQGASDLHAQRQSQRPVRLSKVAIVVAACGVAATVAVSLLAQLGIFPF